jgi:hypothetical protein
MTDWKEDAHFVGAFVRGGSWEVGLRIARRIILPSHVRGRISLDEFAAEAGIAAQTVQKYLATWEYAASASAVPSASELTDDEELDFSNLDQETWLMYYREAMVESGLEKRKGAARHVGRKAIVDAIAGDPSLLAEAMKGDGVAEAIEDDPAAAVAMRNALRQRDRKILDRRRLRREVEAVSEPSAAAQESKIFLALAKMRRDMLASTGEVIAAAGTSLDTSDEAKEGYEERVVLLRHTLNDCLDAIESALSGKSIDNELEELINTFGGNA